MAVCSYCGKNIPGREIFSHQWKDHRPQKLEELAEAQRRSAEVTSKPKKPKEGKPPKNGSGAESKVVVKTTDLGEAVSVAIAPRRFEMDSTLLWQARAVAIKEWKWPNDIDPSEFLDTYLFESFKQRGIILGAYQVIERKGGGNGS